MDTKTFKMLVDGAEKVARNAVDLYHEAVALTGARAYSRALFLHQISMEECAKVEVIGTTVTGLLMGEPVNLKKLGKVFASHERKNRINAYFLKASGKEKRAQRSGLIEEALKAFELTQDQFHTKSNQEKNAALYVDFQDGKFQTPVERITPKLVSRLGKLNKRYLQIAAHKVELLQWWEKNPGRLKGLASFEKRMEELRVKHPTDPEKAMAAMIAELSAKFK